MNPEVAKQVIREMRDLLLRVRVLLDEDLEDFGPTEAARHKACMEEIDRLQEETKPLV